eukprot:3983673-Pyramimonas_sp.AAC.1
MDPLADPPHAGEGAAAHLHRLPARQGGAQRHRRPPGKGVYRGSTGGPQGVHRGSTGGGLGWLAP